MIDKPESPVELVAGMLEHIRMADHIASLEGVDIAYWDHVESVVEHWYAGSIPCSVADRLGDPSGKAQRAAGKAAGICLSSRPYHR